MRSFDKFRETTEVDDLIDVRSPLSPSFSDDPMVSVKLDMQMQRPTAV